MSRHRNVRGLNYNEEYDEVYNTAYGTSVEDDYCISPGTEAQFTFNRSGSRDDSKLSGYFQNWNNSDDIMEEDDDDGPDSSLRKPSIDAVNDLNDTERAQLVSCVLELQNVVGETVPEPILREKAIKHQFDIEKALDEILNPGKWKQQTVKAESSPKKMETNESQQVLPEPQRMEIPEEAVKQGKTLDIETPMLNKSPEKLKDNLTVEKKERKKSPAAVDRASGLQVIGSAKQVKTISREAMLEEFKKERADKKPLINLVVVGHVDAGKSTLMGHLLYRLGQVSKKNMHRYETDSKKIGKASFLYAWVLDETDEERTRGITMDIAQSNFETSTKSVNLLDAPGHRDFIPNMITGAAQADVALLVVDATKGEFEAGFEAGGQTREHTLLIKSLGVNQITVVVNKLDNVNWSKGRYDEIVTKLMPFLKQVGFKEQDITFVPCSGLTGENLTDRSTNSSLTSWYSGPSLVEVIDSFKEPERPVTKPFRLSISDIFKGVVSGVCVSGRIESGAVQIGQKLIVMPPAEQAVTKAISLDENSVTQAFAGDQVALTLTGCDAANIGAGNILCDFTDPSPVTTRFHARIVIFNNVEIPITKGFPVVLHCKNLQEQATIKKIISQLNKSTGLVIRNKPRCLPCNTSGIIEIETSRSISIELYQDYKDLGRIMLRSKGTTIAAGLVVKIL